MKKRYVLAGSSSRAFHMFALPMANQLSDVAEMVAVFDPNPLRAEYFIKEAVPNAKYYDDFDKMLAAEKPDTVIVATIDCHHHTYIIRALEAGYDVITEKPLTIDENKANEILAAQKKSGKKVNVIFNCRFMPFVKRVKELLLEGLVGDILNVDFEWLLDRSHGADYFRRWHSKLENSGGLMVHKATHHFDMVNWWIDQVPETVFANGSLRFYGKNGPYRGERCLTCAHKKECSFAFTGSKDPFLQGMYFVPEAADGYYRDRCLFSEEIDIYDNMSVVVKYDKGALLTYSLVAHSPYEGWKIAFTGTNGRIEIETFSSGEKASLPYDEIRYYNTKGETHTYRIPKVTGMHGGGDMRLLEMLIKGDMPDPMGQLADTTAGIHSIMIGVCANKSIQSGEPYCIKDLIVE